MRRLKSLILFGAVAAFPGALAYAQVAQTPQALPPAAPPAAVPAPQPPVVVLPPPLWDPRDAQELLAFISQIGGEGLDPADYDPAGLIAALRSGNPQVLAQVASDRFNRVASDLALGHVRGKEREDWHIPDPDLDNGRLDQLLRAAVAERRVSHTLRSLLPTHPQYRDLKNALSITPRSEVAKSNRIRLNMDRWRWLPRDLGAKYVIVNVPAYYVALVENGTTRWRQRAIAGAIKTPTPMLTATASGVILNPWWEVPKSIEPEVRGKKGYVPVKGKDGKVQRWRQPPGPSNALGHLKFVMPNPKAIFLHDTNARSRFNNDVRSLSHGCIRTQNVLDLATELLTDDAGEWTREKIDEALASKKTVQANFVKPLPVYIVYFSSAAATDGRIVNYTDVYKRDAKVIAALLDQQPKPASAVASR
ncbi:L,D-transpeptidase family protein [Sphingomonas sp.]|uniref:L,D-transpeptidase family protein n=1 Tax=Sphingomonas sp. TaxID=28214 RepID=UPI00286E22D2|nr:L,D-transpeptidase family protein [Sphingomonas sp.]